MVSHATRNINFRQLFMNSYLYELCCYYGSLSSPYSQSETELLNARRNEVGPKEPTRSLSQMKVYPSLSVCLK